MTEPKFGRRYAYSIQYYLVWCVKYRHRILSDEIDKKLKEILAKIASDNGFTILELETDQDHVHLLIDCSPQTFYSEYRQSGKRCFG